MVTQDKNLRVNSPSLGIFSLGSVVSRSPGVVDPSCHVHRLSPHFLTHPRLRLGPAPPGRDERGVDGVGKRR